MVTAKDFQPEEIVWVKSDREKRERNADKQLKAFVQAVYLRTRSSSQARWEAKKILKENGCDITIIDDFSVEEIVTSESLAGQWLSIGTLGDEMSKILAGSSLLHHTTGTNLPTQLSGAASNLSLGGFNHSEPNVIKPALNGVAIMDPFSKPSPKSSTTRWAHHDKPPECRKFIRAHEIACSGSMDAIIDSCKNSTANAGGPNATVFQGFAAGVAAVAAVASGIISYHSEKQEQRRHDENRLDEAKRESSRTQNELPLLRNEHDRLEAWQAEIEKKQAEAPAADQEKLEQQKKTVCLPSAPLRQIEGLHGGRISGSS